MAGLQTSRTSNSSYEAPEDVIAALRRGSDEEIELLLAGLQPTDRAALAIFCYQRAHLRDLALVIGRACDRHTLVEIAGIVGEVIYEFSLADERSRASSAPRQITLSNKPLRIFAPPQDDDEMIDGAQLA